MARVKAENALLFLFTEKSLEKYCLTICAQLMRAIKKDPTFRKVIETHREFKDTEGFDWLESTELAVDKYKFLLNRLFVTQSIPNDED